MIKDIMIGYTCVHCKKLFEITYKLAPSKQEMIKTNCVYCGKKALQKSIKPKKEWELKLEEINQKQKQYVKDNCKIPLEEHKQLGLSLELIRLRLINKKRYKSKTQNKEVMKIIRLIEKLKDNLDYELCQEYPKLTKTNGFYYGRDKEVYNLLDKKDKGGKK